MPAPKGNQNARGFGAPKGNQNAAVASPKVLVSTWVLRGTREALEASATAAGRTLSAEVEWRLTQSFREAT